MSKGKAKKATPASTNEVFIKDQVLTMSGSQVITRRPRKQGEGRDNSVEIFKNKTKKK